MSLLSPQTAGEAAEMIRAARAQKRTLDIEGGATRAGLGRPRRADATLSTRGLTGITLYEPAELVVRARSGTPLAEVEAALAEKKQILPFEPMDHRAIYGTRGEPTIGAVAACNVSGPRRVRTGAARDSLIGVRFINGAGEDVQSGGRVMKNVTGLDLVKLSCGAHGTLGLITEVTFKLLPAPRAEGSLALDRLDDARAVAAMSAALGSPFEVSAAAHDPARRLTVLRIETAPESVAYRLDALAQALKPHGAARRLAEDEARDFWTGVRDARPLADRPDPLWRLSVAPGRAAALTESLAAQGFAQAWLYDWGGGLIWLAGPAEPAAAQAIHAGAAQAGGHATLVRASEEARARLDVFQPISGALRALTARVKASVDPDHVFNPGRMYADI
jgi:glycolate oxidase FAD binding subunit